MFFFCFVFFSHSDCLHFSVFCFIYIYIFLLPISGSRRSDKEIELNFNANRNYHYIFIKFCSAVIVIIVYWIPICQWLATRVPNRLRAEQKKKMWPKTWKTNCRPCMRPLPKVFSIIYHNLRSFVDERALRACSERNEFSSHFSCVRWLLQHSECNNN